jgi:hypothetical protein
VKRINEMVDRLKKTYPDRNISIQVSIASWGTAPFNLYISAIDETSLNIHSYICEYFNKLSELKSRVDELITTNPFKENKIEPNNRTI